mgnify:CR=1 FL=1
MPEYGCWLDLPSPQVAEIMAQVGFDFIVIDMEHGAMSVETAQVQMMAIGAGARAIVRVPEGSEAWIKRVLDAGAGGVMVPKVESAAQAAEIVSWAYYAPKGQRGDARRVVRASDWGRNSEAYKAQWNADGFVSVQIESVSGLENIEAIAAVEGVTQLFFGPSDYSADAGVSIDSDHTLDVAAQVAKVAKAHGLHSGSVTFTRGTPQALAKLGFSHISVAGDVAALSDSLDGSLRNAKG